MTLLRWIWWHTRSRRWWATGQYQATPEYMADHIASRCEKCKLHGKHHGWCISGCPCWTDRKKTTILRDK